MEANGVVAGATATSGRWLRRTACEPSTMRSRSVYCVGFRLVRRQYASMSEDAAVIQSPVTLGGKP